MNRVKVIASIVIGGFLAAVPAALWAQEMPPMGPPPEMKEVGFLVGTWKADDFQFKMDPSAPFQSTSITMEVKSILGGAAQSTYFSGQIMGMSFEGIGTLSFNRETGKWQNTWIDNMSAYQVLTQGGFEDDELIFEGSSSQMGQEVLMKDILAPVSDTEMKWRMDISIDGGATWFTSMKATYKKQ